MSITISGVVTNGVVVPSSPLPEGASVEIHIPAFTTSISPELREELDGWERASDESLELIERLALSLTSSTS